MSLHTLANHLQSAGRGEDKVLVHMTPGEVNGLQSLAMANGGSLTINPETGLPEAGFLSRILPMIAGFALGPAGLGMTALNAGLASAAIGTALTGDLKQGLMAGLGAYGGAGLGQGLMAQGAGAGAQGAAGAGAGAGSGLTPTTAGVSLQNTGATVGVKASPNMFSNVANVADDVGYAGFKNPVLDAGFKNPVALTAPPAAPSVVGPTSAYSPAGQFNVGQNLSGTGATSAAITPPAPTLGMDRISSISAQTRPVSLAEMSYAPGMGPASPDMSYALNSGNIPTPVNPVVRSELLPGGSVASDAQSITRPFTDRMSQLGAGIKQSASLDGLKGLYSAMPTGSVIASGLTLAEAMKPEELKAQKDKALIRPYDFEYGATDAGAGPYSGSAERTYFNPMFTARTPYEAPGPEYAAAGGLMGYAMGGPVENMSNMNAIGANTGYPMASLQTPMYSNPNMQQPEATNVIAPSADVGVGAYTGEQRFAAGGVSDLGGYSDGGRLLRGPGDGVSDSIPASIGNRQPARLADGEFVVPARIVSEIGNGSTEAGARKLYAMMDRVQRARRKTVGKDQVARNTKAEKLLPA